MLSTIRALFEARSVEYAEAIPFSLCRVIHPKKRERVPFPIQSVIVFAIPYYAGEFAERNVSLYALAKDYHLFFRSFSRELMDELQKIYPKAAFAAFADSSFLDERDAAAKAGLGVIGQNGLLLTEKYASFVFLGEIVTDLPYETIGTKTDFSPKTCEACGRCLAACPKGDGECLSALTQKKGDLTQEEIASLRRGTLVWGCDLCQTACPHTKTAQKTPFSFFVNDLCPLLSEETVTAMSEEEFSERAFSWRGRAVLLRNLALMRESPMK